MTSENKPDNKDTQKARISMDNIGGIRLKESRISYSHISVGTDSRISYSNISNKAQTQTKKTSEK